MSQPMSTFQTLQYPVPGSSYPLRLPCARIWGALLGAVGFHGLRDRLPRPGLLPLEVVVRACN